MSPAVAWAPAPSAPTLPPGKVHVWRVDLDVPPARLAALAATLSGIERERALRFRFDRHRDRWTAARGALRVILAGYLRQPAASLDLAADANTKPFLRENDAPAPLRFSLAHTDGVALVAVAWQREVGVDIEREAPDRADLGVARRMFTADETLALAGMPPALRCRAFFALWTVPAGTNKKQKPGRVGSPPLSRVRDSLLLGHWRSARQRAPGITASELGRTWRPV